MPEGRYLAPGWRVRWAEVVIRRRVTATGYPQGVFTSHRRQAASVAEAVLEYQPRNLEALLVLAAAQVELGLDRRARATIQLIEEQFPSVDVAEWLDRNPYQSRVLIERWKNDLAVAGAISSG